MVAVPLTGGTATDIVDGLPGIRVADGHGPAAWTVAVVDAVASPTTGGWFGAASDRRP